MAPGAGGAQKGQEARGAAGWEPRRILRQLSRNCDGLREVNLYGAPGALGAEGARRLAAALRGSQAVERVNLQGHELGDAGVEALCTALVEQPRLTAVNLAANGLSCVGAEALARALRRSCALTAVNLRGNSIGEEGVAHLASALESNARLVELRLEGNWVSASATVRLQAALGRNRRGRARRELHAELMLMLRLAAGPSAGLPELARGKVRLRSARGGMGLLLRLLCRDAGLVRVLLHDIVAFCV